MKTSNGHFALAAWFRSCLAMLLAVGALGALAVDSGRAQVRESEGTIQDLRLGENELVINGIQYKVSLSTKYSVRGSYGAFQMLQEGMKVKFTYTMHSNEFLEISELEQVPDNTLMFEH